MHLKSPSGKRSFHDAEQSSIKILTKKNWEEVVYVTYIFILSISDSLVAGITRLNNMWKYARIIVSGLFDTIL